MMRNSAPRKGDRFRAKRDLPVIGVVTFSAPFSGGFRGTLPRGEIVVVENDPPEGATGVYLRPERYSDYEQVFVSPDDRGAINYDSYAIAISFEELARDFEVDTHAA